jgi:hypothetical protein
MFESPGNDDRSLRGVGEPQSVFSGLRDRPAPEIDSQQLWRRIEARLTPRRAPLSPRRGASGGVFWRWASVAAGVSLAALALWAGWGLLAAPPGETQLVLLAPGSGDTGSQIEQPAAGPPAAPGALPDSAGTIRPAAPRSVRLDVRLVRGFDGTPPAEVSAAAWLGVGGADALADARARIATLLPFEDFGVVGAWQGDLVPGRVLDIELSEHHRLTASALAAAADPAPMVRVGGLRLTGGGPDSVPADLALEPGRLYILGVVPPGAEAPSLVLLIRAEVGPARAEER